MKTFTFPDNNKVPLGSNYPPLTLDNLLTIKGQPVTKMINSDNCKNTLDLEEWIYYNIKTNTKECYLFKNERLVSYNKTAIN